MRAAALSAPPASATTPASAAAPAASSGALTARSSGRALSGLQRGAACRTRGELDAQLGALCRAVLARAVLARAVLAMLGTGLAGRRVGWRS